MFQQSDKDGIIIGGSPIPTVPSALTIMNNFTTGRSGRSDTYDNDILCYHSHEHHDHDAGPVADFEVMRLEIWGFEA